MVRIDLLVGGALVCTVGVLGAPVLRTRALTPGTDGPSIVAAARIAAAAELQMPLPYTPRRFTAPPARMPLPAKPPRVTAPPARKVLGAKRRSRGANGRTSATPSPVQWLIPPRSNSASPSPVQWLIPPRSNYASPSIAHHPVQLTGKRPITKFAGPSTSKNELDLNIPLDEKTGNPVRSAESTQGPPKRLHLDIDLNKAPLESMGPGAN